MSSEATSFINWRIDTIAQVFYILFVREGKPEPSSAEVSMLTRDALCEIDQSVMGNRSHTASLTAADCQSLYEATLLWCLRKLGRPEVAPA